MLQDRSHLTNLLSYITAVIKDALRLFSPASCTRQGNSQTDIIDDQDHSCSTNDGMMRIIHVEMHRASQYWKRPNEFLLERWLVDENHELYSMKDAWRSFEHESRNCIAQDLMMTKLRVMLALLIREFSFEPAYDEWDRPHPRNDLKTYRDERAYQIEEKVAHSVEHYPCRVTRRKAWDWTSNICLLTLSR
jgi:cytochrome P450